MDKLGPLQFNDIHIYIEAQLTDTLFEGNTINLGFRASKPPGRPSAPRKQRKTKKKRPQRVFIHRDGSKN